MSSEPKRSDTRAAMLAFLGFLGLAIALGYLPRLRVLKAWSEHPEQHWSAGVPTASSDSYYWFRLARELTERGGEIVGPDPLRHFPDGAVLERVPALPRAIAAVASGTGLDVYQAGVALCLVLSVLFTIPLALACRRLGAPGAGLVGAMVTSASPAYFHRTAAGRVDTDGGNQLCIWLIAWAMLSLSPTQRPRTSAAIAAAAGAGVSLFCWWYDQRALWLLYALVFPVHLALLRFPIRRSLVLCAVFLALSNPLNALGSLDSVRELAPYLIHTPEVLETQEPSTAREPAGDVLAFPSVAEEIEELRRLPLARTLAGVVRPPLLAALGLVGFIAFVGIQRRAAIALVPVALLGSLALTSSLRFTMYLAPLVGIGLGTLAEQALRFALELGRRRRSGRSIDAPLEQSLIGALSLLVFFAVAGGSAFRSQSSPAISSSWIASLQALAAALPPDAVIWHSWGSGYLITDVTQRATVDDGLAPHPVIAQLLARGLTSDEPRELARIAAFVASTGRSEIERLASGSTSYDDLLETIARSTAQPDRPAILLLSQVMLRELPRHLRRGRHFEPAEGVADELWHGRCRRAGDTLHCALMDGQRVTVDLERGLIDGAPSLRRSLALGAGPLPTEREYRSEGVTVQVLEAGAAPAVLVASESVFRSNFNQMFVLGRFDPSLFSLVFDAPPTARAFGLSQAGRTANQTPRLVDD